MSNDNHIREARKQLPYWERRQFDKDTRHKYNPYRTANIWLASFAKAAMVVATVNAVTFAQEKILLENEEIPLEKRIAIANQGVRLFNEMKYTNLTKYAAFGAYYADKIFADFYEGKNE